jgi:transcriptional regulator with XRE-family HTH domain
VGNVKKQFGAAVRLRRNHLGISQEELAGRAGLHRTYISDVERGARNVSLESIHRLADALAVPAATLFPHPEGGISNSHPEALGRAADLAGPGGVENRRNGRPAAG